MQALPTVTPMCGQRGEQKSAVGLDVAGNEFGLSSVTCRGAGSPASALKVTRHTSCSTPQVAGGGAGMCLPLERRGGVDSASLGERRRDKSSPRSVGVAGVSSGREHFRIRRRGCCGASGCGAETKGKARQCSDVSFSALFDRCMSPSQRVAHVSDSVARLLTTQTRDMHASMNSCESMHGAVMHDNSSVVHENSCGALGHRNSCNLHAAGVLGGTKASSMSTRIGVRCPAVEKLASPQQAPGILHGETWERLLRNQGPKIFREVEIVQVCAVAVACPSWPGHSPEPPGPGRKIRNMLGWTLEEKNRWFWGMVVPGCPPREESFLFP